MALWRHKYCTTRCAPVVSNSLLIAPKADYEVGGGATNLKEVTCNYGYTEASTMMATIDLL